jgi:hypothetical protein
LRDGRELVEDESCGRPKSTRTEVRNVVVADLVKNDRRKASRMIAEYLKKPKTIVHWILKEDLGKIKLCSGFVPHSLTPEERKDQVTSCRGIVEIDDADKNFFNKIIMGDDTWCCAMTPKQSDRVLNGLVIHPLSRRNGNSKRSTSRSY